MTTNEVNNIIEEEVKSMFAAKKRKRKGKRSDSLKNQQNVA